MTETTFQCPTCRRLQLFEQPVCPDGHGADCPDWMCVVCGTALFVDPAFVLGPDVEIVTAHVA